MVSLSSATIILLPSYSCSCWRPDGTFSSEATSRIAKPASRSSSAAFSTSQARSWTAARPSRRSRCGHRRRPEAASISITMSPCLAAAGGALVADVVRDVAARSGHLLDQVERLLLELAALAGAALALRRQLQLGLARVVQPLHLALELGDLLDQPLLRDARPLHLVHHRSLEVGQRVVPVLGGELAQQVLAGVAQRLRHQLLHLVLHGGVAVEAEVARDQLGELLRLGVEQLRHRAAVLADEALELLHEPLLDRPRPIREGALGLRGRMLELVANRLDLGPGGLPVEHARADRQRVGDRLFGGDVPLEAALDQLDQRTVRDHKPIDQDLVAARLDRSGAGDALLVSPESFITASMSNSTRYS